MTFFRLVLENLRITEEQLEDVIVNFEDISSLGTRQSSS